MHGKKVSTDKSRIRPNCIACCIMYYITRYSSSVYKVQGTTHNIEERHGAISKVIGAF